MIVNTIDYSAIAVLIFLLCYTSLIHLQIRSSTPFFYCSVNAVKSRMKDPTAAPLFLKAILNHIDNYEEASSSEEVLV